MVSREAGFAILHGHIEAPPAFTQATVSCRVLAREMGVIERRVSQREMQPQRNAIVARDPRAERTDRRAPHFKMSAPVCVIASAELIFIKALFVSMMTNSVQGQFEIIKTAPTTTISGSHPQCTDTSFSLRKDTVYSVQAESLPSGRLEMVWGILLPVCGGVQF